MAVRCNLKGGYRLNMLGKDGAVKKTRLVYGLNDIDSDRVREGLEHIDPRLAKALVSTKKHGRPADIELDVEQEPMLAPETDGDGDGDTGGHMNADEKIELVKIAEAAEDLRELAEGEERKTVLAALDKRAGELQGSD